MSKKTALCIVNFSGKDITRIEFSNTSGFEDSIRDLKPFEELTIAKNGSLCRYVEVDNSGPSNYTLKLTFNDNTYLQFSDDQQNAKVKHVGKIDHTGNAQDLEVLRSSGGDANSDSHGTNGIYIRSLHQPDNSNWMGELLKRKPDVRLNDLTMPGSHDAGIYKVTEAMDINTENHPEHAQTQHLTFKEQLMAGSRYFDIRIRRYNNQLYTAHWSWIAKYYGAWGAHLNDVLNDVAAFMQDPRSANETVILKFSHTDESDACVPIVKRVQDMLGDLLYKSSNKDIELAIMKLSDLKGKVIAVFGAEFDAFRKAHNWDHSTGIFHYYDNPVDATLPLPAWRAGLGVYDNYANDYTYELMVNDQNSKLKKYGGWGNSNLFLLSWTLSGKVTRIVDVEVLAGMANPWLPQTLSQIINDGTERPNIVYIDFIDPYICSAIIDMNHLTEIRQFQADKHSRFYYSLESTNNTGWKLDGTAFYAFAASEQGTVPINQFHSTDPWRFYYGQATTSSYDYADGPVFHAFPTQEPNTVAIHRFYKNQDQKIFYKYSCRTDDHDGWVCDGIAFYAYPSRA